MDYKEILKETGIEFLWLPIEFDKKGIFIPKGPEFPNGAISVRINVPEECVEYVALHEIGHLVSGKALTLVNERLKHLEHCRNEAEANRFLLRNIAPEFVEANDFNTVWASPEKLCTYLGIRNTFENLKIAQEEIDYAIWDAT
ncbi:hypothetical protein [Lactococcus lactis]|uniref:Zn-dependent peptidase ImmA (M78 family) n=1 Tax=Lactococcus lactis TaxID=1358 RepID=A0AAW5TQ73_9LACT|nr:hypothetical protein [Lactococcus lactis]MCW2280452.1 Zn-dependent peptidase ImmA (M78 family) [Lactococcus lactis]